MVLAIVYGIVFRWGFVCVSVAARPVVFGLAFLLFF